MSAWRWRCGDIARACSPCPEDARQRPDGTTPRPGSQHEPHPLNQHDYPAQLQYASQLQQHQLQQPYVQQFADPQRQVTYPPAPSLHNYYGQSTPTSAVGSHTGNVAGGLDVGDDSRKVGRPFYAENDIRTKGHEYDQAAGSGVRAPGMNKVEIEVPHASVVAIDAWQAKENQEMKEGQNVDREKAAPKVSDGFREACAPSQQQPVPVVVHEENEPEPEEQKAEVDSKREILKARLACLLCMLGWVATFAIIGAAKSGYDEAVCTPDDIDSAGVCEVCGSGTLFLPIFGDFERSWPAAIKVILYFIGLLWCFQGIAIVCDQFMAAIEEITSQRRVVWLEVYGGAKQKFPIPVWNATVANLTLMALGSSAPEILLSIIELLGNDNFAGELGPSTIVGSAAFNLLVITAVCISALPDKATKKIEMTGVFAVTAFFSIFAYIWLLFILVASTPDKVDTWEAVVTLLFCPLLVILAFAADKGWILTCVNSAFTPSMNLSQIAEEKSRLENAFGKSISVDMARIMLQSEMQAAMVQANQAQAARRKDVMSLFTGSAKKKTDTSELLFGFRENKLVCLECCGKLRVPVVCSWAPGVSCQVRYRTREGTAEAGKRYHHAEGVLFFEADKTQALIDIDIIDNDEFEDQAGIFTVELDDLRVHGTANPSPTSRGIFGCTWRTVAQEVRTRLDPANRVAQVSILNDDLPGMLQFSADEVKAARDTSAQAQQTEVTLRINRTEGTTGAISCQYETQDITAKSGRDYEATSGTLHFGEGQAYQTIVVPILASGRHELMFQVVLSNPSHGVKFDPNNLESTGVCEVIIEGDADGKCTNRLLKGVCSPKKIHTSYQEWMAQATAAMYCNGSIEDQAEATCQDWFFHLVSLPWKIIFSVVPPASMLAGWLCFTVALAMIGLVTATVGDMAGLLGCSLGLPNDITAITLVALGTSLPDTFASKTAAQQDESADNSVGNITGSNSVNVFLGLGLPWTLGAFFWESEGVTSMWLQHKVPCKGTCDTYATKFLADYPNGGFMVPAGALGISVGVFSACAIVCICLLLWRRHRYKGELGGPRKAAVRDAGICVGLWCVYILVCCINSIAGS